MSRPLTMGVLSNVSSDEYVLYAHGNRQFGQFGDNVSMFQYTPLRLDSNYLSVGYAMQGAGAFNQAHTIAVKMDGTLWGWGSANLGGLTSQYSGLLYSPVQVGTGSNWKYVSSGNTTNALIDNDNKLWITGTSFAQIGTGSWKTIKEVSGYRIGIMSDDTMWGWGTNASGQLGQNNTITYTSPVLIGSGSTWKSVDVSSHVLAVRSDNTLWAWGLNTTGQLGLGNTINRSSPVQVGTRSNWASASCGSQHSLMVTTEGRLFSCGRASEGQLGHNNAINRSSPVQVGLLTSWRVPIAGSLTSFALRNNGTLWVWGSNIRNSTGIWSLIYGNGSDAAVASPVQVGTGSNWTNKIVCSVAYVAAIDSSNDLYIWGANQSANLGIPNTFCFSIVQVGTTKWKKIIGGKNTTTVVPPIVIARKSNKTLWQWGVSATTLRSSPVQIGVKNDWTDQFDVGGNIGAAIDESGRFYQITGATATQLGALTDWKTLSIGQSNGNGETAHYVSTKTNGTLWTFGVNSSGQMGNNSIITINSPVQIGSDTDWKITFGGLARSFAIKNNNTLWAWGLNTAGQLGLGNAINRSSPVQVGTDTNWAKISGNQSHTLSIKTDGTLWAWGLNTTGELGLGNTVNRSSPVQVGTDTNWVDIATGERYSFAIKTDGTLWNWGSVSNNPFIADNTNGTLELVNRSSPVQVGVLNGWSNVIAGDLRINFFLKK